MMREVELSTARACHLTIGQGVASLLLPASKTDTAAVGVSRSHRCACSAGLASPGCPAHAAWDQLLWLKRALPEHFDHLGRPSRDLPLFPDVRGCTVTKAKMSNSIIAAARHLGGQDAPDGAERISGHTLRVTGAQGLVVQGWPAEAVRLLGRWQSREVEKYIRLAPLERMLAFGPLGGCASFAGFPSPPPEHRSPAASATSVPSTSPSRSVASPSSPSSWSSADQPSRWVINLETCMYHVITRHDRSVTVCGWCFDAAEHAIVPPGAPGPVGHWDVCGACDPELKGALLAAEQARIRP